MSLSQTKGKLKMRIRAKVDKAKRIMLMRFVDPFRNRAHRCRKCGHVMYISKRKFSPNLYWKYYVKSMVCDECFDKIRRMSNLPDVELHEQLNEIATEIYCQRMKELGFFFDD